MENQFGQYLRKIRKEQKITLTELALETGLSQSYLSQIENGTRPIPSIEILTKLKDTLDADPVEFMNMAGFIPSIVEAFGGPKKVQSKKQINIYEQLDRMDLDLYCNSHKLDREERKLLKMLYDKMFS